MKTMIKALGLGVAVGGCYGDAWQVLEPHAPASPGGAAFATPAASVPALLGGAR